MTSIAARSNDELGQLAPELTNAGQQLTWLDDRWAELVGALEVLGPVRVTTQNAAAKHVKVGPFDDVSFNGPVGLVLGEPIDLRLFTHHWKWAFALEGEQQGIHIFDVHGRPLMRVDVIPESDQGTYRHLLDEFAADRAPRVEIDPDLDTVELDDIGALPEVVESFQADWRAMEDTHEFFGLLREHDLDRAVAMRIGPPEMVSRLEARVCSQLFADIEAAELPIMVFARSAGCVQIHTGEVQIHGRDAGELQLGGHRFEMAVVLDAIGECWAVRKPTEDGNVSSIEFYDRRHELCFQVFGERKPGQVELPAWTEMVTDFEARFGMS